MREFGCPSCQIVTEIYDFHIDPDKVPVPACPKCITLMQMLFSVPRLDTSSTFSPFDYKDPDSGKTIRIDNLHTLRAVERLSRETGRNIRFDAYSADENNPDSVDGFGPEYWDGNHKSTKGTGYLMPTM